MTDFYSLCISTMNKSEFYQADKNCDHYYYKMINKLLFVVNINKLENGGAEIVYGVTLEENTNDLFDNGVNDSCCMVRRNATIRDIADMKSVYVLVSDFMNRWKRFDLTGQDVISYAKDLKSRFMSEITESLMPLGFKKSGYKWSYYKDEKLSLELYMQKSPQNDNYYFNIYIMNNEIGMPCYSTRLSIGLFDWQLGSLQSFIDSLEEAISEQFLPIIDNDFETLGNELFIKEHCYCKKAVCENCWIKE